MLTIKVGSTESFDDEKQEFVDVGGMELQLEHSLVSLSKWEAQWEKPFLSKEDKTPEEILSYVGFMIVTSDFPPEVLTQLSEANFESINKYIEAKMSATWFSEVPGTPPTRETVTSELIYYWMSIFSINWEAQHWHLNRLLTLIRICNVKNAKPKKESRASMVAKRRELNEQRRQQYKTSG